VFWDFLLHHISGSFAGLLLVAGGILALRIPNYEKVRAEGKQIQVNLDVIARANSEQ
jgi:hypothetical protein